MVAKNRIIIYVGLILTLCSTSLFAYATPDYAREQRWADEVVPGIVVGEPVFLTQKNKHAFLGIFTETDDTKTGVIVVHGMGLHPDWGMIGVLRQRLVDEGFSTLSVQMPVLAADASYKSYPQLFPDAAERLGLAVAYLREQGLPRIALVSHSNGSRMSRVFMAENPSQVNAWVALSLTQGDSYDGIKVPILDVFGSEDLPHVLSANEKRKASLLNPQSDQLAVAEADHFFSGKEEVVVKAIKQFLDDLD